MSGLEMLGATDAVACEGDSCAVPASLVEEPRSGDPRSAG
jgi:hypothetical protein